MIQFYIQLAIVHYMHNSTTVNSTCFMYARCFAENYMDPVNCQLIQYMKNVCKTIQKLLHTLQISPPPSSNMSAQTLLYPIPPLYCGFTSVYMKLTAHTQSFVPCAASTPNPKLYYINGEKFTSLVLPTWEFD